jgi:hypothetical protein
VSDGPSSAGEWSPPSGDDIELLPAGLWWDVLRVEEEPARRALERLGEHTGAVLCDPDARVWYWLVRTGALAGWSLPGTRPCTGGTYVGVPPVGRVLGSRVHWRVPPLPGQYLTDVTLLREALEAALGRGDDRGGDVT